MTNNAEKKTRFIAGEITRCHIAEMREYQSKSGETYKSYSLHIKGYFEDDNSSFDGYLNSNYPIHVYEGGEDPIDPKETNGLKFLGRVLVTQRTTNNGALRFYPSAVSIEERIGTDEPPAPMGNPFLKNDFA